ncbi:MAG: GTPase HflX [Rhodospirillaceae bacterium]
MTDRCAVIHPEIEMYVPKADAAGAYRRSVEANLIEALALAGAIDLEVVHSTSFRLANPRPSTLLGKGMVEIIGQALSELDDCPLVIVNAQLTPVQQRNLEKAWDRKVIDRTGLILEIFGARARTGEGRLQVDLAALNYQLGRLVRSWTHLERQRGGAGFMGGPGERQIELDRRMIRQKIARLKRQLEDVKRTRSLQRSARKRVPFPIVALVGYTNAGKSTLFNRLTGAGVIAKNQLFATLDPTMRRMDLPAGGTVILSDTVGFISDLPHELVNAFHATLEEVVEADIVLHVRDIADPDTEAQCRDVLDVLASLGITAESGKPILEALNKIDLLPPYIRTALENQAERRGNDRPILISAVTGEGCDGLPPRIEAMLGNQRAEVDLVLDFADGKTLAWIYANGRVTAREDADDGIHLKVSVDARTRAQLSRRIDTDGRSRLN